MEKKKRSITLIEVMIVILLIGLIGGALALNMRGSLDEGRAFKTTQNRERLYDILLMESASTGRPLADLIVEPACTNIVSSSQFYKKPADLLKDGWGNKFALKVEEGDLIITSKKFDKFEADKLHG